MRAAIVSLMLLLACASESLAPAEIAFGSESCAFCRMVISDKRFPAQVVSRAHDPLFFDDLDCLARHVAARPLPEGAAAFVTDYKNSTWIAAREASFYRCPGMASPMSSGLIATTKTGTPTFCPEVEAKQIFGRELP